MTVTAIPPSGEKNTKKALRETGGIGWTFTDPSIFSPLCGGQKFRVGQLPEKTEFVCCNEKRTWFAAVRISQGLAEVVK